MEVSTRETLTMVGTLVAGAGAGAAMLSQGPDYIALVCMVVSVGLMAWEWLRLRSILHGPLVPSLSVTVYVTKVEGRTVHLACRAHNHHPTRDMRVSMGHLNVSGTQWSWSVSYNTPDPLVHAGKYETFTATATAHDEEIAHGTATINGSIRIEGENRAVTFSFPLLYHLDTE